MMPDFSKKYQSIFENIHARVCQSFDASPRFGYFTLHGKGHLENLFSIYSFFKAAGVKLDEDDEFLLYMAICLHDVGMVAGLSNKNVSEIVGNSKPENIEDYIRDVHHLIIDEYLSKNIGYMTGLGLSFIQINQISEIAKCHRKKDLRSVNSVKVRSLGALMRLIDELDIGASRAPSRLFQEKVDDMDRISKWHWIKHMITHDWREGDSVFYSTEMGRNVLKFSPQLNAIRSETSDYWCFATDKPLRKVLLDDGCREIIEKEFKVQVVIEPTKCLGLFSFSSGLDSIERECVGGATKRVIVIDDEIERFKDLFDNPSGGYVADCCQNVKLAFEALAKNKYDLAIVDMQISPKGMWGLDETSDYKQTGIKIAQEVNKINPSTKVVFMTGTKHELPQDLHKMVNYEALVRKPLKYKTIQGKINEWLCK